MLCRKLSVEYLGIHVLQARRSCTVIGGRGLRWNSSGRVARELPPTRAKYTRIFFTRLPGRGAPRQGRSTLQAAALLSRMLYLLLLVAALLTALNYSIRRHFNRLLPAFRLDSHHGPLQLRRYPKLAVAEVRVTGSTSVALRSGQQILDKYFREEGISRFALPIMAEKIDSADSIWSMAAVLPMDINVAPAPKNKAVQLKELPAHRVIARYLHGPVSPDEMLARQKSEMLPLVNDLCAELGSSKLSTVIVMHRFPSWMPSLFRVSDLLVRISESA